MELSSNTIHENGEKSFKETSIIIELKNGVNIILQFLFPVKAPKAILLGPIAQYSSKSKKILKWRINEAFEI